MRVLEAGLVLGRQSRPGVTGWRSGRQAITLGSLTQPAENTSPATSACVQCGEGHRLPLRLKPPFATTGSTTNGGQGMTRQRLGLFTIAVGMSLHALLMGRLLESFFGIAAFAWGFIAWASFRNRLDDAQAIAISMTAILFAAALAFGAASGDHASVVAHLSLALAPAAVGFACVVLYIAHIRRPRVDEPLTDWTSAVAMAAAAKIGKRTVAMPPPIVVGEGGPQLTAEGNDLGAARTGEPADNAVSDERAA